MAEQQVNNGRDFESEARGMGWKPKEEFRGDPDRWSDAETYVKRGEEFLPIVQSNNRKLKETVDHQQTRLLELERVNKANAAALEAIQESNREQTVQQAVRTIEDIAVQIAAAREAGNVTEELALLREHAEVTTKLETAKKPPVKQPVQQQAPAGGDPAQTPEFKQFLTDNSWWQTDAVMRAASIEIQNQLYSEGKISAATPQGERLEMVAEATRKRFNMKDNGRRQAPNRVEGGGGPGAGGASGSAHSFNDLPAEAKAACDKAAKRLTFGDGKRFKDEAAWRQSYANTYFTT